MSPSFATLGAVRAVPGLRSCRSCSCSALAAWILFNARDGKVSCRRVALKRLKNVDPHQGLFPRTPPVFEMCQSKPLTDRRTQLGEAEGTRVPAWLRGSHPVTHCALAEWLLRRAFSQPLGRVQGVC